MNRITKNTIKILMTLTLLAFCSQVALAAGYNSGIPGSSEAFSELVHKSFPLTPAQIHQFKTRQAEQRAASARAAGSAPAVGTSSTIPVSLNPGHIAPVIRIGQGMITSLVFTDQNGKVWPVTSYFLGNPSQFDIEWSKPSGVLMVQGKTMYGHSNIGVMLKGLNVPVMLTLLIGQHAWDYLDYVRVQANMPGDNSANASRVAQAPNYLIKVLDGIPPKGAKRLQASGSAKAYVWSYNGNYVLLTQATLISPEWTARANGTGPNPLHAYQLRAAPVIMLSYGGKQLQLNVSKGEWNND